MSFLPRATPEEIDWGADAICDAISSGEPFFIGRNGTIELETLFYWFAYRKSGKPYPAQMLETISKNAGVWPPTEASIDAWANAYSEALGAVTGLAAGWYEPYRNTEENLLQTFAPQAFTTPLRSLEPYYVEPRRRWTGSLNGKKVAVVSSFATTIERQVARENATARIWAAVADPESILPPTTNWCPVRSYYSPAVAGGPHDPTAWPRESVSNWQDAVTWTANRVRATGASVAIIGCGGLGMLIAAQLKRHGISSIVLGGATQVLFGIKGRRWESHAVIGGFWNDAWVWPRADEMPAGAGAIEGGCYWGGAPSPLERPPTPFPALAIPAPLVPVQEAERQTTPPSPSPSQESEDSFNSFFLP